MKLTNRQIEIEEALHQITGGLAKLATLAGADAAGRIAALKLAPGVTTADKLITVDGGMPDIGLVVDGPAPSKPSKSSKPSKQTSGPSPITAEIINYLGTLDVGKGAQYYLTSLQRKFGLTGKELARIFFISERMIRKIFAGADSPTVVRVIDQLLEGR